MIWFTCKHCGKRHNRPDSQAGSMLFCDCGTGVRVPWSSSAAPDAALDAEPVPIPIPAAPPVPPARPVPQPPRRDEEARPRPRPVPKAAPPADLPLPARQTNRIPRRVRPNLCYNHDEDASSANCTLCRLPFCANCLVMIQGEPLCGPCKNFAVAGLGRPTRPLPRAVLALIVALVSAPVMFALSLLAIGLFVGEGLIGVALALCLLGLVLPGTGLWLSLSALSRMETLTQYGGRGLAAGGACASAVGLLWTVGVTVIVIARASGN
jgi:hypothetical protein